MLISTHELLLGCWLHLQSRRNPAVPKYIHHKYVAQPGRAQGRQHGYSSIAGRGIQGQLRHRRWFCQKEPLGHRFVPSSGDVAAAGPRGWMGGTVRMLRTARNSDIKASQIHRVLLWQQRGTLFLADVLPRQPVGLIDLVLIITVL